MMSKVAIFVALVSVIVIHCNKQTLNSNTIEPNNKSINTKMESESESVECDSHPLSLIDNNCKEQLDANSHADNMLSIKQLLGRIINDEIWFNGEHASFGFLCNSVFKYNVYRDIDRDIYNIIPTSPVVDDYGAYYYISLYSIVVEDYGVSYNNENEMNYILQNNVFIGNGSIDLNVIEEPKYDNSDEDMNKTCEIIKQSFENSLAGNDCTLVSIRRYYTGEPDTIIVYNYNEQQCYAYFDVDGKRMYKPSLVESEDKYFIERIFQVSHIVNP